MYLFKIIASNDHKLSIVDDGSPIQATLLTILAETPKEAINKAKKLTDYKQLKITEIAEVEQNDKP